MILSQTLQSRCLSPDTTFSHVKREAVGAIYVPGEGVVDPWVVPMFYLQQAILRGAKVANLYYPNFTPHSI
jgi:hypothetical protein